MENIPEALDAAGEWYLNTTTQTLWYIPVPGCVDLPCSPAEAVLAGVDPNTQSFVVPTSSAPVLTVDNAEGHTFENMTIAHNDWNYQRTMQMSGSVQAASFLLSSGVYVTRSQNVRFSGCVVRCCQCLMSLPTPPPLLRPVPAPR